MTQEEVKEIIAALECCAGYRSCRECPRDTTQESVIFCLDKLSLDAASALREAYEIKEGATK